MEHGLGDETSRDGARAATARGGLSCKGSTRPRLGTACRTVLPAALLVLVVRLLLVGVYVVPTGSMAPTIMPGDLVLGERVSVVYGQ